MPDAPDLALFIQGQEMIDRMVAEAAELDDPPTEEELRQQIVDALIESGHDPEPPPDS